MMNGDPFRLPRDLERAMQAIEIAMRQFAPALEQQRQIADAMRVAQAAIPGVDAALQKAEEIRRVVDAQGNRIAQLMSAFQQTTAITPSALAVLDHAHQLAAQAAAALPTISLDMDLFQQVLPTVREYLPRLEELVTEAQKDESFASALTESIEAIAPEVVDGEDVEALLDPADVEAMRSLLAWVFMSMILEALVASGVLTPAHVAELLETVNLLVQLLGTWVQSAAGAGWTFLFALFLGLQQILSARK